MYTLQYTQKYFGELPRSDIQHPLLPRKGASGQYSIVWQAEQKFVTKLHMQSPCQAAPRWWHSRTKERKSTLTAWADWDFCGRRKTIIRNRASPPILRSSSACQGIVSLEKYCCKTSSRKVTGSQSTGLYTRCCVYFKFGPQSTSWVLGNHVGIVHR